MTRAQAPGKVILLGEHSVVYGRPAIAVPVTEVRATAVATDARASPGVTVRAEDIGRTIDVAAAPSDEPLSVTVRNTLAFAGVSLDEVRIDLAVRSTIPVASGLGSGAAVSTAIVRALSRHLGLFLEAASVSSLVYETEKIHHGTPSGIDNTVVAYERPVYFCGRDVEIFEVGQPIWLAIADTGVPSLTRETVADVRAAWEHDTEAYEELFDEIGGLVTESRAAISSGDTRALGSLMDRNQGLLCELDVSSPDLEALIEAAKHAGALGAKLSGGGRGGNAIAVVEPQGAERVRDALRAAGARNVIVTEVK